MRDWDKLGAGEGWVGMCCSMWWGLWGVVWWWLLLLLGMRRGRWGWIGRVG